MDLKPKLKICGITTLAEVAFLNQMDVDYIGFVFAKSRRQVSPQEAKILRQALRTDIRVVGVFVNEAPEMINQIATDCRLDIVQLHGQESQADMGKILYPIWNAIGVKTKADIQKVSSFLNKDSSLADAILLDYHDPGSGQTFDWSLIPDQRTYHLVLAGGINPDNVQAAIQAVKPDVIDVSSGVEEMGKKSETLVNQMIRRVKDHE